MRRILILVMILGSSTVAAAQSEYGFTFSKAGTAGLQFLKIGVGAREVAMGEAASSITNDVNSVFWNPGALPLVETYQAAFTHASWLAGSRVIAAAAAIPAWSFVFGLSVESFAIEDFEETTVQLPEGTGTMVSAGDIAVGVTVSRRFSDRFTFGLQGKWVNEDLAGVSVNNFLFDVGALYYFGFHHLRAAFVLQHFGADMKYRIEKFRTPLLFRVGAADDLVQSDAHRFTIAVDLIHPTDNKEWVNVAAEYEFLKFLSLRAGYRLLNDYGRLTFGGGVSSADLAPLTLRLDYAFAHFGDAFGATHRLSLVLTY
jgi:hypothetical protein